MQSNSSGLLKGYDSLTDWQTVSRLQVVRSIQGSPYPPSVLLKTLVHEYDATSDSQLNDLFISLTVSQLGMDHGQALPHSSSATPIAG